MKRTSLEKTTPLRRKDRLERRPQPQRRATRKTAAAETGFSRAVKLAVRKRAGNDEIDDACCEACGRWLGRYGGQVHHRAGRGSGGCRDSVTNGPANALLLCGTALTGCHGLATEFDEHMEAAGFWIRHGTTPEYDPRNAPVMWHARGGSGVTLWLAENGEYVWTDPLERGAA